LGRGVAWLDTGTHESMMRASSFIEVIEQRQGLKVACIEEIAYFKGYIDEEQVIQLAHPLRNNGYGRYLLDLIQYGEVIQAWIGITVQDIDEKLTQYLRVPGKKGVIIKAVEPESPARKAGLEEGDIILSFGTKKINDVDDYVSVTKSLAAGDTLKARIWRNGKKQTVAVKTKVFPLELADELAYKLLGIKVAELTAKNKREFRIIANKGVVILEINRKSQLARIGARSGDVIRQIDDYSINNSEDFKKAIVKNRGKNSVVLLLQRGEQGYYITITL
jgi:S1-C subfamily serine protease